WDHQGFEHGHTLYDELLHVPLIIHGPGIESQRIDTPVSLLDVVPTILDLLGQPVPKEVVGRSLMPLVRHDPDAESPFLGRDQAFGRPLYGFDRWGVLHGNEKWTVFEGRESLFALDDDPGEKHNVLKKDPSAGAPFPDYLGKA